MLVDEMGIDNVYQDEGETRGGNGRWQVGVDYRTSRNYGVEEEEPEEGARGGGSRRGLMQKVAAISISAKIGSRPPACGKAKCKGCSPCAPVQVTVPPAQHTLPEGAAANSATHAGGGGGDFHSSALSYHLESPYYSVAWKCRCKGQLFNP